MLDVEVAGELLRDRRAALHRLAGLEVLPGGTDDRPVVDTRVVVEVLVLDRDGGVLEGLRHLVEGHRLADRVALDRTERRAVRRVDERGRTLPDRLQLVNRWRRGHDVLDPEAHG